MARLYLFMPLASLFMRHLSPLSYLEGAKRAKERQDGAHREWERSRRSGAPPRP